MLFGTGSAKFTSLTGTEVLLENSTTEHDFTQRSIITTTSIYDHFNTYNFVGDYSEFTVKLNLWKYTTLTTDPVDKYNEIYPYLFNYVYFWPHEDGRAISGSNGSASQFFIDDIQLNYLMPQADAGEDIMTIHFRARTYTSLTGSIL